MKTWVEINYLGMDFELQVDYEAARPAPKCSDHDSAAFSDCGDGEQITILNAIVQDKHLDHKNPQRESCPLSKEFIEAVLDTDCVYELISEEVLK